MLGSLPRHLVLSLHLPRPKGSVRFGRDDDEAKEERKEPRKRRDEPNRGKTRVNILSFGDGTERSEWWDERRMECLLVSFPSSSRLLPLRSGAAGGGWEHGRYEPWVRSERSGERNEPSVFPSPLPYVPLVGYSRSLSSLVRATGPGYARLRLTRGEKRVTWVRHER